MTTMDRSALERAIDMFRIHLGERSGDAGRTILAAAQAHLETLPRTKMVEVWRVEFATKCKGASRWLPGLWTYETEAQARQAAESARIIPQEARACVKVTGPHKQEVPA